MRISTALRNNGFALLGVRSVRNALYGRGWGGFHGDAVYQQLVLGLLQSNPFTSFVETGTSRGYSTELVALRIPALPVLTAEVLEQTYRTAHLALKRYPNITQLLGSSDHVLRTLIADRRVGARPFFYLDAHWEAYWPLRDEVASIAESRLASLVVIDDFEVPGEPQFEFDTYPATQDCAAGNCNLEYLRPALRRDNEYRAALPTYSRGDAFGARSNPARDRLRGHLVLFQNMSAEYDAFVRSSFGRRYYRALGAPTV